MEVYDLTKRDTLVVVSGYNDEVRAKIIDRWIELETSTVPPKAKRVRKGMLLRTNFGRSQFCSFLSRPNPDTFTGRVSFLRTRPQKVLPDPSRPAPVS